MPHDGMGFGDVLLKMVLEEVQNVVFRHFWRGGVPYCPIEFLVFGENISVEKVLKNEKKFLEILKNI